MRQLFDYISLVAGLVLMAALSIEIVGSRSALFSQWYMTLQLIVCCLFLLDFVVHCFAAADRKKYLTTNLFALFISIPYSNLIVWFGADPVRTWAMIVGFVPLARGFYAMWVVVRWLTEKRVHRLLLAYTFTIVSFTYLAAVVFYHYEIAVNAHLHGFGNALWWAAMNVTTVGAAIFPVTAVGKILSVVLPTLGMLMLPVFTVFVTNVYTKK